MQVDVSGVFQQMIILFLLMAVGYAAGKTKVMSLDSNKNLSRIINCITNPCNVLYSALCNDHALSNSEVFQLIAIAAVLFGGLVLIAQIVPKLLRVRNEQCNQYKFMMIFSNIGYMGIPVISSIYGSSAVFYIAIFIMVFNVVLYTYGVYLLCGDGKVKIRMADLVSPMMICSFLSLIFYLLKTTAPVIITDTLDTLGSVTTPCAMLIVGCALSTIPVREVFTNWRLYLVSLFKLLVIPIAGYVVLRPIVTNVTVLGVVVAILGMPVATNFTMLSAQYDRDQKLAAAAVFITTLLSVVSIPMLMQLLFAG